MGRNVMGGQRKGVMFPTTENKFGKVRDSKVGEAVREVIIRAMCNYSSNANNLPISTEFNITTGNNSDLNICEQCFLATPITEIFTESGSHNASACTKDYLPKRFQPCAMGISYGNASAEEISECYKDALKNTTIEFCSNSTNSSDPAERFEMISSCLRRNKREFKKEVRMVMMDRVIGGSGCSFSALIALKLFGDKKRNSFKKDMDFDEALDDMLEEELEDDELEKPFKWTKDRPKWRKNNSIQQGGPKGWNKGVKKDWNNEGNNGEYNRNNRRRGQSGGRKNRQGSGLQIGGENGQIGGRFGGNKREDELGSEYGEYDYDNDGQTGDSVDYGDYEYAGWNGGKKQGMGQGKRQGMGQGNSNKMGQRKRNGMGQRKRQEIGQFKGQGMGKGKRQGMGQGMGQGQRQGMGQGQKQGMGQRKGQGMEQGIGQGNGQRKGQGMGQGKRKGMGQGMGKGKKQGTGQGMGKDGMVGTNNGWEDNDYNNNYDNYEYGEKEYSYDYMNENNKGMA